MDSQAGPLRTGSVSPSTARKTPYARPAAEGGRGLLSSLMRRGLGWITGSAGAGQDPEAARDEEGAPLNSTPALARSKTASSLIERPRPVNRNAANGQDAFAMPDLMPTRSLSPKHASRRKTAHSRLDLSNSYGSTMSGSQSLGALPDVNGAEVFGSSGQTSRYDPSSVTYMQSHSPFASPGPRFGQMRLRSPSPTSPRQASQVLYPHLPASRSKRGLSPLNPHAAISEASFTGNSAAQHITWSPSRAGYAHESFGSQAHSSVYDGSRRETVFGDPSASRDPPRIPQNEAERILDVLESMRAPRGTGRAAHSTRKINVPVAVVSSLDGDLGYSASGRSIFISPYARRQQIEHEERQEEKRRTLSDALKQRDRESADHRQRQVGSAAQIERSASPQAPHRRRRKSPDVSEPTERPISRAKRKKESRIRRTEEGRRGEGEEQDAMEEDTFPVPESPRPTRKANNRREDRSQLSSPGAAAKGISMQRLDSTTSPPLPVRKKALSPPADVSLRASRASSTTSMRPGRTHTSRTHIKASATGIFTPDDDDDPPTDEHALSQAKMPKFSFPANFSFGVSPAAPAETASVAKTAQTSTAASATLPALPILEASKALKSAKPAVDAFTPQTPPVSVFDRTEEKSNFDPTPAVSRPAASVPPPPVQLSTVSSQSHVSAGENPFAAFQSSSKSAEAAPKSETNDNPFAKFQGFGAVKNKGVETSAALKSSSVKVDPHVPPATSSSTPVFGFGPAAVKPAEEASKDEADTSMAAEDEQTKETPKLLSSSSRALPLASAPTFAFPTPTTASSPQEPSSLLSAPPASSNAAPKFSFMKPTENIATSATPTPAVFSFASDKPNVSTPPTDVAPAAVAAPLSSFTLPKPPTAGFTFGGTSAAGALEAKGSATATFSFAKPSEDTGILFGKSADATAMSLSGSAVTSPAFSFFKPPSEVTTTAAEPLSTTMVPSKSGESRGSFDSTPASGTVTPFGTAPGPSPFTLGAFNAVGTPVASTVTASASNPFAAFQSVTQPSSSGPFGMPSAPQSAPQPAFSFGAPAPKPTPPAFTFGAPSSTAAFGSQPLNSGSTPFGSQAPATQPAFSSFGAPSSAAPTQPFTFGSAPTTNGFGSQPAFGTGGSLHTPALTPETGSFNFGGPPAAPQVNGSATSLFNIGSGGNESPNARRIKPLPQSRRGSRR